MLLIAHEVRRSTDRKHTLTHMIAAPINGLRPAVSPESSDYAFVQVKDGSVIRVFRAGEIAFVQPTEQDLDDKTIEIYDSSFILKEQR